jgi:hypothetical protein
VARPNRFREAQGQPCPQAQKAALKGHVMAPHGSQTLRNSIENQEINTHLCLTDFCQGHWRKKVFLINAVVKDCDTGYSRGTCTPMIIVALFTIAKLWKQPRCPTTDE